MNWMDAKGTIKETRALDVWMEKASKRWSVETWTTKLRSKGMKEVPKAREPLMEAAIRFFTQKHPEFRDDGPSRG